jgi:3-oxoacyl-[acyl-carrier protein] reductase
MNKRIIIVTGASSGIGLEIAQKLQAKGDTVIWCSRNIEADAEIKKHIKGDSSCLNTDVSNESSVINLFQYVEEKHGRLDALINCAGFVIPQSLLMTSFDNWKKTIDINLTGTFLCCKYGLSLMKKTGGRIINIASTAGLTPRPGWSAYAAAKSGVINFSHAISEELNEYNIKVFVLCPGRTATPLRKILAPTEDPSTIMQPGVVADTAIYCLSKEADALEGQPILVRERF